jgi:hypothetical protein
MTLRPLLAAAFLAALPAPSLAQAAGGPELAPAEAEAYEMGLEMTFVCDPNRHRMMTTISSSSIQRASGALPGTATFLRSAEGTFLVLEAYDEEMAGHCMVLAWFGGDLEPGRYAVRRLGMDAMEEEVGASSHSFFTLGAVRSPEESSVLVADSGTLSLESFDNGALIGSFEVTGFVVEGGARTDGVTWGGTFTALERDP